MGVRQIKGAALFLSVVSNKCGNTVVKSQGKQMSEKYLDWGKIDSCQCGGQLLQKLDKEAQLGNLKSTWGIWLFKNTPVPTDVTFKYPTSYYPRGYAPTLPKSVILV